MTPEQLAVARGRAYQLFAMLCRQGVTEASLPLVQVVPELASALPDAFDPDEAAAAHHQLFGLNVLAYEAVFLDPDGLLEGPVTEAVGASYRRGGRRNPDPSSSLDALDAELAYLAFLCGAEADALRDGLPDAAHRAAALQTAFLREHLLRWLPAAAIAVARQGDAFYTAVVGLLLGLVDSHVDALSPAPVTPLPATTDLLSDEKTGLRDLAAYLTSPSFSGAFLSRDAVAALARRQNLPRGFAGRSQMLVNAWRAAASFDAVQPFVAALRALFQAWESDYVALATAHPALAPAVAPWRARVAETEALLAVLARRIETEGLAD
jgi:TorA maturation chaperone TorD